jgi:hypothetical protein
MSFAASCGNIRLETGSGSALLICDARDEAGNWTESILNLDDFIGNEDGIFPTPLHTVSYI